MAHDLPAPGPQPTRKIVSARHARMVATLPPRAGWHPTDLPGGIMAKRGRKKRDRKHSKANHGKRPNCGSKAVK